MNSSWDLGTSCLNMAKMDEKDFFSIHSEDSSSQGTKDDSKGRKPRKTKQIFKIVEKKEKLHGEDGAKK